MSRYIFVQNTKFGVRTDNIDDDANALAFYSQMMFEGRAVFIKKAPYNSAISRIDYPDSSGSRFVDLKDALAVPVRATTDLLSRVRIQNPFKLKSAE